MNHPMKISSWPLLIIILKDFKVIKLFKAIELLTIWGSVIVVVIIINATVTDVIACTRCPIILVQSTHINYICWSGKGYGWPYV